jgi:hypothetical protein
VHKNLFNSKDIIIEGWPEVFDDLYISTMPASYLNSIKLEFNNGRIWEFGVDNNMSSAEIRDLSDKVLETIYEYHNDINKINFGINVDKLKRDVQAETKKIF